MLVVQAPYKMLQMGAQKKQKRKKKKVGNRRTDATDGCFSKETVLQPKRTRKLWRSDKVSKGNPGEISESLIKEKVSGEQERCGKVVRRTGSLHPA